MNKYTKLRDAFRRHPEHRNRKSARVIFDLVWQKYVEPSVRSLSGKQKSEIADQIADVFYEKYEGNPNKVPLSFLTTIARSVAAEARSIKPKEVPEKNISLDIRHDTLEG